MNSVAWFKDVGIADRPTVGGKGGSLGELTRAGIAVPPGFVVTTSAFELFLAALEAREPVRDMVAVLDPDDLGAASQLSENLRRRVIEEPMPSEVEQAIRAAHAELSPNGEPIAVPGFGWRDLDASDLLLTASVEGLAQEDVERKIREGLVVYGPDPSRFEVVPRASNRFFPGEDLAFYLEVYNLDHRDGIATIDMKTTLEKLHPDGTVEYAVTSAGSTSSLTKYGIDQWNIGRTLGLGGLALGEYNLVIEIWDRQARKRLERTSLFNVVTPEEMIELYNWKQLDPPSTRLDKEPHGAEG